jgi:hypothetical protein
MEKRGDSKHQSWRDCEGGGKKKDDRVWPSDRQSSSVPTLLPISRLEGITMKDA